MIGRRAGPPIFVPTTLGPHPEGKPHNVILTVSSTRLPRVRCRCTRSHSKCRHPSRGTPAHDKWRHLTIFPRSRGLEETEGRSRRKHPTSWAGKNGLEDEPTPDMPLHSKRGRGWGPPAGITDTDRQRRVEEDGFTTMGPWGMRPWPLTFLAGRPITSSGGGAGQLTSWVNANHSTPPLVNRVIALDSTSGHWLGLTSLST